MTATVQPSRLSWRIALTVVVALLYVWVGSASDGVDRIAGLLGAAAILASIAVAGRSRSGAIVLLLGALPLAVLSWWSVATPVLAGLALVLGWPRSPCRTRAGGDFRPSLR